MAGYASCVIMITDVAAKKAGFDIAGVKIMVSPVWAPNEPIFDEINVMLLLPRQYTEEQLDAAPYCREERSYGCGGNTSLQRRRRQRKRQPGPKASVVGGRQRPCLNRRTAA